MVPERALLEGSVPAHDSLDEFIIDWPMGLFGSDQDFCGHGDDEGREIALLHHCLLWIGKFTAFHYTLFTLLCQHARIEIYGKTLGEKNQY